MLPLSSRLNLILNQLQDHLNFVRDTRNKIEGSYNVIDNKTLNFYESISYFVHYILLTPELEAEFCSLLEYRRIQRTEGEFTKALDKVKDTVQKLGEHFCKLPGFPSVCKEIDEAQGGQWKNVFSNGKASTEELLLLMSKPQDMSGWSVSEFKILSDIIYIDEVLDSIYKQWPERNELTQELVVDTLVSLGEIIKVIDYNERYQYRFVGAEAAEQLMDFYFISNPKQYKGVRTKELQMKQYLYQERKFLINPDDYVFHCEKIYRYLKHSISVRVSKKLVIERFKTYMEIYRAKDYLNNGILEKEFQKEFEEFIFLHGLYPISELQMGNGRLDSMPINADQAFLCELKQIGFEKQKDSQSKIEKKIKLAMQEPTVYHGRLAAFPHLLPEVHAVIFTAIPFRLTEDSININGLHYYFYIVDLSSTTPSSQDKIQVINPRELFMQSEKEAE